MDANEKVLCLFSLYTWIIDSNASDIWVILKALELCHSNLSLQGRNISVVSDSKVAMSLVKNRDFGNMEHIKTIIDI